MGNQNIILSSTRILHYNNVTYVLALYNHREYCSSFTIYAWRNGGDWISSNPSWKRKNDHNNNTQENNDIQCSADPVLPLIKDNIHNKFALPQFSDNWLIAKPKFIDPWLNALQERDSFEGERCMKPDKWIRLPVTQRVLALQLTTPLAMPSAPAQYS